MRQPSFFQQLWRQWQHHTSAPDQPLAPQGLHQSLANTTVVVFDQETTGLNQNKDEVLSIGAVKILPQGLSYQDQFYVVLNRPLGAKQRDSQLIHGLTQHELAQGQPPEVALQAFLDYRQDHLCFAFHAPFDQALLNKSVHRHLGLTEQPKIFDIAEIAQALYPDYPRYQQLDDWLQHFGLTTTARHQALGDAVVSAELLLILRKQALLSGHRTWADVMAACDQHKKWSQRQQAAAFTF